MSKDNNKPIDYDFLVDNALRGVVKTVLKSLENKILLKNILSLKKDKYSINI